MNLKRAVVSFLITHLLVLTQAQHFRLTTPLFGPSNSLAQELPLTNPEYADPGAACKRTLLSELRSWDAEIERLIGRVKLGLESKADYERLKQELLDKTKLFGLIDLRSQSALELSRTIQFIKTTANLLEDALAFHPAFKTARGAISVVTRFGELTSRDLYDLLKNGQSVRDMVESGTAWEVWKASIAYVNPAANAVVNLTNNLDALIAVREGHTSFVHEMETQLAMLDREILRAEQTIDSARFAMEAKERIRQAIDLYCQEKTDGKMLELVEGKRSADRQRQTAQANQEQQMAQMVSDKRTMDQERLAQQQQMRERQAATPRESTDSGGGAAFGDFLQGLLWGFSAGFGAVQSPGLMTPAIPGNNNRCDQARRQIEANNNWLSQVNPNEHRAAYNKVVQGRDATAAWYNQNCR